MSVFFTETALDRMKEMPFKRDERQELGDMLRAVDAATGSSDLAASFPETVSLDKGERGTVLLVPLGRFRAVVAIEPAHPDRMVVASLYRADKPEVETVSRREAVIA